MLCCCWDTYCCAAGAIAISLIALNMEPAALGALEYIPPSPLEFSVHTRKKNSINRIPQTQGQGNHWKSMIVTNNPTYPTTYLDLTLVKTYALGGGD